MPVRISQGQAGGQRIVGRFALLGLLLMVGCQTVPKAIENPTVVPQSNYNEVWETTIDVLERYFDVAYENRYDGRIETLPSTGPTLFEPWLLDAVGFRDRLEGTLQTVRRRAFVLVRPAPTGGFSIQVEVYKELENLAVSRINGYSSFISSIEPTPEALVQSPIVPTAGWISMGRDEKLEKVILERLRRCLDTQVVCSPFPEVNAYQQDVPTP